MKIVTVTYNDLGISWGPAVHYLELWNECRIYDGTLEIEGWAPSWTSKTPIVEPQFPLKITKIPKIPLVRQIIWDLLVSLRTLVTKADVFYIREGSFHLFSAIALRLRRVAVAIEINGRAQEDNESRGAGRLVRNLSNLSERLLLRRADVTFNVTDELRRGSEAGNPRAVHVHVDNGVASTFFGVRMKPSKTIRFIYVGTFTPWDGADRIIALAKVRPDLSFVMVGDGSRRRELQDEATPNVEFSGWRAYADLPREYGSCNAGIVLYTEARHRSIGMSSLKTREYVAAGLPVFSTKVQGQEFIESRGFGLLSDGQLNDDLQRFLDRYPEYRANLEAARAELVKEFSWSATAAKTVDVLKRIAAPAAQARAERSEVMAGR